MESSAAFLLQLAFKSSLLLAVAWALNFALRCKSAAFRQQLWSLALATALVLPLLSAVLPAWRLPANNFSWVDRFTFRTEAHATELSATEQPASTKAPKPAPKSRGALLTLLWTLGSGASLLQMVIGWIVIERMRRNAIPLEIPELDAIARQINPTEEVEIRQTNAGTMPVAYGLVRHTILLPADVVQGSPARRRAVFIHELVHVQRRDSALQFLARATLVVYWWHPLVWAAWRKFLRERENATDDQVLLLGSTPTEYAGHLLSIARSMHSRNGLSSAVVAMARPSHLESRLAAILDPTRDRRPPPRGYVTLALLSALVVVSPWAALQAKQDKAQTAETVASSTTDPAANALLEQGKAALSEKRYTDAFALFSRAQVADSQLAADAEMWQALTQELQGNLEASEGYYKQALALALPNSNSQITIMDLYTRLLISLNKAGEAKLVSAQEAAVRDELAQQIKSAIHHDLDVYKIGGNVRAPILIEKIEPEYTFDARLAKYTGSAVLSLEIDDNGIPRNIRIIRGLGLGLDERAVEAVRHWKFEPASLNGSSVAVLAQVEVNFKLL